MHNDLQLSIEKAAEVLIHCYEKGGKVLICGNGGSAADAGHLVGELMKNFESERPLHPELKGTLERVSPERGGYLARNLQQGLPAISLSAHGALTSAIANDMDADLVFAQQVNGYGKEGDVLIGISTSGNSQNVLDALITARAKGIITIGFSGESGGKMKAFCDILIAVPATATARVQELHLPIYHSLCRLIEQHLFSA